ncbi:MAG: Crp/Fnr family transcriptional regulator [Erythrobacter sp.]
MLEQRGWLSWQPPELRAAVLRAGRLVTLGRRETLSREGDDDPRMFGIVSGFFGCSISHRHGYPVLGTLLGPGDWFGEGPLVEDNGRRQVTFSAMQSASVLVINSAAMTSLRSTFPDLDRRVAALATWQVRYLTEVASELLVENVADRIVAVLLRLCADLPAPVLLPVVQDELGEMSNASRNSVNKILRTLAALGLVRCGYGGIEVFDPRRLSHWYESRILGE